jgi:hypothetical protein
MKKLVVILAGLLLLAVAPFAGCNQAQEPADVATAPPAEGSADSCVNCHTDKSLLQQTVSDVVVEKPEEASGEG